MINLSDLLQKHERLILAILALGVVLFLGSKFIDHKALTAEDASTKAQQVLTAQQSVVSQLTQQLQSAQQHSDVVAAQTAMQIAAQQAELAVLRQGLALQQASIRTKPITDVAVQWSSLIGVAGGIQNTDKGLLVDDASSRATVEQLVSIPVLNTTVRTQASELTEKESSIDAHEQALKSSLAVIDGLNVQIADAKTACNKEIAAVKASDLKSKKKWFTIGYVAGLATRGVIRIFAGV